MCVCVCVYLCAYFGKAMNRFLYDNRDRDDDEADDRHCPRRGVLKRPHGGVSDRHETAVFVGGDVVVVVCRSLLF